MSIVNPVLMKDGGKEIKKAVQASFEGNGIVGDSREEWGTEKEKAFCELLQSIRAIARTMRHEGADIRAPCAHAGRAAS